MPENAPDHPLHMTWWLEELRTLGADGHEPWLDELRLRLNLRLLLVVALSASGLFLLQLYNGRLDEVGLFIPAGLGAWAYVKRHPRHNRLVARLMLAAMSGEVLYVIFLQSPSGVHLAMPSLMVLTVFGTLVEGVAGGGLIALLALLLVPVCLSLGISSNMPLVVVFSGLATLCLYLTCLSHTWMFRRLAKRQRESGQAVAEAKQVAEALTATLDQDVAGAIARLRAALAKGLGGLGQASELQQLLAKTRAQLPASLPRTAIEPDDLLEGLQASVHRFFLWLAVLIALAATGAILASGTRFWQLSLGIAMVTSLLLLGGGPGEKRWRWRLYAFLAACLGAFAADVALSRHPPTASLVFLPLLVFFSAMLAPAAVAVVTSLLGLALLAWSHYSLPDMPGLFMLLRVLAMLALSMLAMSQATAKVYRELIAGLRIEEERLRTSLGIYRKMVSTLFHDLANPLAVLQSLGALPSELLTQEDESRAQRMLLRLESVAGSARPNAVAGDEVSVALLADQLLDLFRDKLKAKGLSFTLTEGADIILKRGGGALRELLLGHLLSNAVKYSPAGGAIQLGARARDGWITLTLQDQGRGFPDDVLNDISNGKPPFVRPGSAGELGNGFGLLEVMASARSQGGHLALRNLPEGGAEAELWLPQAPLGL